MGKTSKALRKRGLVSVNQVRSEGVIASGHVPDSSVLFVLTERGLRLFHAESLRVMFAGPQLAQTGSLAR